MIEKPSLKNLTSTTYGKPSPNQNEFLQSLGEPHVSSFNYMLAQGLQQAIDNLTPAQFKIGEKQVKILIKTAYILPPAVPPGTAGVRSHLIYPTECRQRGSSYTGSLHVLVDWFIDGRPQPTQDYAVGQVPIMVKVIAIVNLNDQLTAEPGCVRDSTADDTWCSIIFGCLKVFVAIGLLYGVYTYDRTTVHFYVFLHATLIASKIIMLIVLLFYASFSFRIILCSEIFTSIYVVVVVYSFYKEMEEHEAEP